MTSPSNTIPTATLPAMAAKIVDEIGLPALADIAGRQSEATQMSVADAIESLSSCLIEGVLDGVAADEDVVVEFSDETLVLPASDREALRAQIVHELMGRESSIKSALAGTV